MRALKLADEPTYWQRVLHGGSLELRQAVTKVLSEEKEVKSCFRYACCGLSDQLVKRGGDVFVGPKGCGHKLCPRCGRRRGGKYAKRIIEWLAHKPHGDLWQMVLTQRVQEGESLKCARDRMAPKQRRYMRWLDRRGMTAGMTVVHIVWSPRAKGWHYHVHILAQMPANKMTQKDLLDQWVHESGDEGCRTGEEQARRICNAGPAIEELKDDGGDTDFWRESKGEVAKAVQYPMRDLAQGVSAWRLGGDVEQMEECARELVRHATGWKCFRAWGEWRKKCPVEKVEEEDQTEDCDESAPAPGSPTPLGYVGYLWRRARKGDQAAREVFAQLERSVRNDSEFAKRLIRFCRTCMCGEGTG